MWLLGGNISSGWTSAVILSILKPDRPKIQAASYRPIALTSVMCKICERMIANRISTHLLENKILDRRYLGFQPFPDSHSTLIVLHQDLLQAKKEKKYILGISLELQAAYDSVYIDVAQFISVCKLAPLVGCFVGFIASFSVDLLKWSGEDIFR